MEYLPWYVVYGHFVAVMIVVLFALVAVGYVFIRRGEQRRGWRVARAAILGAVTGFLISNCAGALSYGESTHRSRSAQKTPAECLDSLKPAFVASTSLRHRSDALSRIGFQIRRDCQESQQSVEMRTAAIELDRGSKSCDNLAQLYLRYLWFSRVEELYDRCEGQFSIAEALEVRLALGDFETASSFASEYERSGEELIEDDYLRHAKIHVAARQYPQAQKSLERALEAISELSDPDRSDYFARYQRQHQCALAALQAKQGDKQPLTKGDGESARVISCQRYFADLLESDALVELLTAAFDGRQQRPSVQLDELLWPGLLLVRHDAFSSYLLSHLVDQEELTHEQRWRRANLYNDRAIFELRLEHLDDAKNSLDDARADIDFLLEHDESEQAQRHIDLHRLSFRIEQIESILALRKGDIEETRHHLDNAQTKARSPLLSTNPDDPHLLQFGTTQLADFMDILESGELDKVDDITDWPLIDSLSDDRERLIRGIFDDDASTIIEILKNWDGFSVRPEVVALLFPFLSEEVVAEIAPFVRWNASPQMTHIYQRSLDYALDELNSKLRLATIIGDQQWADQFEPVVKRYHDIYFDLDTYRLMLLIETPSSNHLFRWTIE